MDFAPEVDGVPRVHHRHFMSGGTRQAKKHEAFIEGQVVGFRAMLPDGLSVPEMDKVLKTGGRFRGISPYGWRDGYGRFELVEIQVVGA